MLKKHKLHILIDTEAFKKAVGVTALLLVSTKLYNNIVEIPKTIGTLVSAWEAVMLCYVWCQRALHYHFIAVTQMANCTLCSSTQRNVYKEP